MPGKLLRPSPEISATEVEEGTIDVGGDGLLWVSVSGKTRVQRWIPYTSATLNGLKVLTLDYVAQNIGVPLRLYEISASLKWPAKRSRDMYVFTFTPTGDARYASGKTVMKDWLKGDLKLKPGRNMLFILGEEDVESLSVARMGNQLIVTSNPRNTQTFRDVGLVTHSRVKLQETSQSAPG